ncbi:enoyl-CoA hydratase [Thermoplasma volcanium GSS1]|uniref:Enoyl-CoA hydratase n=1 Tax=Thermoplasma volcanium (strain ATCC 51530 / DSM 4299 / JCM 9571 / NBRC 15438 / GSS1) TaxID=273116 RepID=Q97CT4_THEVO|nr:enoyl-CoA hydratase/isomerase family protein [Thermoplasma volcanium]BAB59159.1 enoyl-CoA hydratase [Thermoplasma volcanium GSS1]
MSSPNYRNISLEDHEGIRIVTIRRENSLNPLNLDTLEEIEDAVRESGKVVVLKGSEKAFSAGADINNFLDMSDRDAFHFSDRGQQVMDSISDYERPVIAAVHGYALGGGFELALACDFRISDVKTKYGFPEVNLGIMPGFGGTQRIIDIAGKSYGMYLVMTGKTIDEQEALKHGIVDSVSEKYLDLAIELAKELSEKPATSIRYIKEVMNRRDKEGYMMERERFALTFKTEDHLEGIRAFKEKRKAVFKGK